MIDWTAFVHAIHFQDMAWLGEDFDLAYVEVVQRLRVAFL